MEVIRLSTDQSSVNQVPSVLAIGFFDGVHLGHQHVINEAKKISLEKNIALAVMTFEPHPKEVIDNKQTVKYVTSPKEKLELFNLLGVDLVYVVSFTKALSCLSKEAFVDLFIINNDVKHVVTGFDFRYGYQGEGNVNTLISDYAGQFEVTVISKIANDAEKVSSTKIRDLLALGQVEAVKRLLGRAHKTSGKVVHGFKRGRTIGYPTANLLLSKTLALPKVGVYYVRAVVGDKKIPAMANLGYIPTFSDDDTLKLEVHLLDYEGDLYDQILEVEWISFIRDEIKFTDVKALIAQLQVDEQMIRKLIQKN